jgi:hypothetical protein
MTCATHGNTPAVGYCSICGKALCEQCKRDVRGAIYCEDCIATRLQAGPHPPNVPRAQNQNTETTGKAAPEALEADKAFGPLKTTLILLVALVMFIFSGFGAIANFELFDHSDQKASVGQGILYLVLSLVFGALLVSMLMSTAKRLFGARLPEDAGKPKLPIFVNSVVAKWKLIAASVAPITAVYHFLHGWGLNATLPQILLLIGMLTTLSLGIGGFAYWLGSGIPSIFSTPARPNAILGTTAAAASVLFLIYKFPTMCFMADPSTSWRNPVMVLFAGFGLALVFAAYFWLIWNPIHKWLDAVKVAKD